MSCSPRDKWYYLISQNVLIQNNTGQYLISQGLGGSKKHSTHHPTQPATLIVEST